jgi:hypothetical protein
LLLKWSLHLTTYLHCCAEVDDEPETAPYVEKALRTNQSLVGACLLSLAAARCALGLATPLSAPKSGFSNTLHKAWTKRLTCSPHESHCEHVLDPLFLHEIGLRQHHECSFGAVRSVHLAEGLAARQTWKCCGDRAQNTAKRAQGKKVRRRQPDSAVYHTSFEVWVLMLYRERF